MSYENGKAPFISLRIQELYDVNQTPKIALGRVPVTVHILTPGMKPIQVTQDLASFLARALSEDQIGAGAEISETFVAMNSIDRTLPPVRDVLRQHAVRGCGIARGRRSAAAGGAGAGRSEEDQDQAGRSPQPCACFDGKLCKIYADRPRRCRLFECGLLKRVQDGEMTAALALKKIARARKLAEKVRELIARTPASRTSDWL